MLTILAMHEFIAKLTPSNESAKLIVLIRSNESLKEIFARFVDPLKRGLLSMRIIYPAPVHYCPMHKYHGWNL